MVTSEIIPGRCIQNVSAPSLCELSLSILPCFFLMTSLDFEVNVVSALRIATAKSCFSVQVLEGLGTILNRMK